MDRLVRERVRRFLPERFIELARALRSRIRHKRQRITRSEVDRARIVRDLKKIGIKEGDILLVHSSLKSIGYVKGGADTVIDAFMDVLGPNGTLVMPSFSLTGAMSATLESDSIFDPDITPATVGRIPETFRQRKGGFRSVHPTHSLYALGPKARWITEGHDKCRTNFGDGTPYHKIMESDGKILGLGIDLGPVTFYHVIEDMVDDFPVAVYLDKEYEARVIDNDGVEKVMTVKAHNPEISKIRIDKEEGIWIREFFTKYLTDNGFLKTGVVGEARTWVIRAIDLFETQKRFLEENITIYTTEEEHSGKLPEESN
ncbi:AAC(3) family N-acetyltransferase [Candidatus Poribacteria bacterium]